MMFSTLACVSPLMFITSMACYRRGVGGRYESGGRGGREWRGERYELGGSGRGGMS